MPIDSDPASVLVPLADDSDTDDWLLVTVPLPAWAFIDLIRRLDGRPTRSTVANELVRRALSIEGPR